MSNEGMITNKSDIEFDLRLLPFGFVDDANRGTLTVGILHDAMNACFVGALSVENIHIDLYGYAVRKFMNDLHIMLTAYMINDTIAKTNNGSVFR